MILPGRHSWLLVAALYVGLLTGCATKTEVENIIRDSNYDALMAETSGPAALIAADGKDGKPKSTAEPVVSRIETFIAQHPKDTALINPLRLRQAIVYLNQKSFANADAAFAAVDKNGLNTARDTTLFDVHESLAWWFEHAEDEARFLDDTFVAKARNVMEDFRQAADKATGAPDVQDYLREARAWIALKLAAQQENAARGQTIKDAIDLCSRPFTTKEEKIIKDGKLDPASPPFDRSVRLALRMDTLLNTAADLAHGISDASQRPRLENPTLQTVFVAKIAKLP